jgi:hypothetical protein
MAVAAFPSAIVVGHVLVREPELVRYEVTLPCGCHWWEYRHEYDPPPMRGPQTKCTAPHRPRPQRSHMPIAEAASRPYRNELRRSGTELGPRVASRQLRPDSDVAVSRHAR